MLTPSFSFPFCAVLLLLLCWWSEGFWPWSKLYEDLLSNQSAAPSSVMGRGRRICVIPCKFCPAPANCIIISKPLLSFPGSPPLSLYPSVLLAQSDLLPAASRCFWVASPNRRQWPFCSRQWLTHFFLFLLSLFFAHYCYAAAAYFHYRGDSCQKKRLYKSTAN